MSEEQSIKLPRNHDEYIVVHRSKNKQATSDAMNAIIKYIYRATQQLYAKQIHMFITQSKSALACIYIITLANAHNTSIYTLSH